ncbi:MAG: SurA N-terminal domain-containing protein, partial [Algiphilus sp.]
MLQSLRDRMSGVVAWFIVGLLIIPFAFFGIDQFTTSNANPEVASVGDRDITLREFQNAYNQRYQRLVQMLGENFDPSTLDRGVMRQAVLEDMIQQEARLQYAQRQGWRVSDQVLMQFLQEVPAFQRDGQFSPDAYRELLAQQGMSPQGYEQQLREGLRAEQLRNAVVNSAFVVPEEVARARAVREQQRSFAAVRVPVSRFLGEIEADDAALQATYEANRDAYRVP